VIEKKNNTLWWIIGGLVVLLCCCLLFMVAVGGVLFGVITNAATTYEAGPFTDMDDTFGFPDMFEATPDAMDDFPTATPQGSATREPGASLPPAQASSFLTEEQLKTVIVPGRDLRVLAEGLRGVGTISEVVRSEPRAYKLGDSDTFWVSNEDSGSHQQIKAKLVYVNDVLYIWVEEGVRYDLNDIKASADKFAKETYPTNREYFGSEWSPGVDSDPRLHILHSVKLGSGIAGYFSGADEVSNKAQPYSNEREMFSINIDNTEPNSDFYDGVLAHEFQHMIHWYQDKNEATWVNEGLSELAMEINNYDTGGSEWMFTQLPDTQLNAWSDDPNGRTEHYGASYLMMSYFAERFGHAMMQAVVADDANGIDGFNNVLAAENTGLTFDDVFADWVVANLLDDPELADGQYGYQGLDLGEVERDLVLRRFPAQIESDVSQYATDYIELKGNGTVTVDFRGAITSKLAANKPYSGQSAWWANREDDSDARLTRSFDLSGVNSATLSFMTWYDIEDDWDYAYVMASSDGGKTWKPLQTEASVDTNPNGNSFGWALTGCSGDPTSTEAGDTCNAKWVEQTVSLDEFTGNAAVLIRFQYITDDAVNYPGFFVDDVSIPEINFSDDMESVESGWQSEGWILSDNILRQRWLLQVIELEDGKEPVITRVSVDEKGLAQLTINGLGSDKSAILAISGLAPVTTEKALYEFSVTAQ